MTINNGWDLFIFFLLWLFLTSVGMIVFTPVLLLVAAGKGDILLAFLVGSLSGGSVMYLYQHNRGKS